MTFASNESDLFHSASNFLPNNNRELNKIDSFLWLGSRLSAMNRRVLEKNDIVSQNCLGELKSCNTAYRCIEKSTVHINHKRIERIINSLTAITRKNVTYHFHPLDDTPTEDLLINLEPILNVLQEIVNARRNVLVHCVEGISRSAAICCAFLMRRNKWQFERSLNHVKTSRAIAHPNKGFQQQLELFAKLSWKSDLSTLNGCQEYKNWLTEKSKIGIKGKM